ncbi:MAG: amidohydrolase [Prevotellaceae bacterium]|jgi:predicted amidohydrolase|nr:amidohydrolase [Prevotellaceae bacterium]
MKIALLQTAIAWENKQENIRRCEAQIRALPGDVRLVVWPEMFTTGFSMHAKALAETEAGDTLQWLRRTAVARATAIAGSVIIEERERYFNRLFFVFPDGSYQTYDKRHLFSMGDEHRFYTAGTQRLIVAYAGWRICPLVCYDLRFPVWSRNYGEAYDLLLYVANWPAARLPVWDTLLPARAIENQCYVAGVNCCGRDGAGTHYGGRSQVVDFKGQVVAVAGERDGEALIATLSRDELDAFRKKFPVGNDADRYSLFW